MKLNPTIVSIPRHSFLPGNELTILTSSYNGIYKVTATSPNYLILKKKWFKSLWLKIKTVFKKEKE